MQMTSGTATTEHAGLLSLLKRDTEQLGLDGGADRFCLGI